MAGRIETHKKKWKIDEEYTKVMYNSAVNNIKKANTPNAIEKKKETFRRIKHQQGKNNSQYGTMWITNGADNKKIKKELPISEG